MLSKGASSAATADKCHFRLTLFRENNFLFCFFQLIFNEPVHSEMPFNELAIFFLVGSFIKKM